MSNIAEFERLYIETAVDTIDAAIFTGDAFSTSEKDNELMRYYLKRWKKELKLQMNKTKKDKNDKR